MTSLQDRYTLSAVIAAVVLLGGLILNPAAVRCEGAASAKTWPSRTTVGDTLTMDAGFDNAYVQYGSNGEVYLNVALTARDASRRFRPETRRPLNLAIVIDKSGSMNDENKITYVKEAARQLVRRLSRRDRVAVIAYNESVYTIQPSTSARRKDDIIRRIDALYADGWTNLSGGLTQGIEEVRRHLGERSINRVILLSDGLANRGVTDMHTLRGIARETHSSGVTITTMGVGYDFNEDLMTTLSLSGGGHYYYIDSPTELASIFDRELDQVESLVARDASLRLSFAPGVSLSQVYGYAYENHSGGATITLGSFSSGEERKVLVRLRAPTHEAGPHPVVDVTVAYDDLLHDKGWVSHTAHLGLTTTNNIAHIEKGRDNDVLREAAITEVSTAKQKAANLYKAGRAGEAQAELEAAGDRAGKVQKVVKSKELADSLDDISGMNRAMSAPMPAEARKDFVKRHKAEAHEEMQEQHKN